MPSGSPRIAIRRLTLIQHRSQDRWIQVNERRITGGGTVAVYTDISELKRHEAELEIARDEAMAATQAKSKFLASMSHELRTPLNAILGFTRIVMRRSKSVLPLKQYENLEKILTSAEHLLGLINSILDLSKVEAGRMDVRPSEFTLEPLLDLCLKTVEPLLRSDRVRLVKDIEDGQIALFTDQDKLRQILINLLSNAVKFTDKGEIRVRAVMRERKLLLAVADTGAGIPASALAFIFEEFRQVDDGSTRTHKGTGLGLSISRRLAMLLGGEITVESELGVGSTFTLAIPMNLKVVRAQRLVGHPSPLHRKPAPLRTGLSSRTRGWCSRSTTIPMSSTYSRKTSPMQAIEWSARKAARRVLERRANLPHLPLLSISSCQGPMAGRCCTRSRPMRVPATSP